mgnify:CR=1 FL=1
MNKEQMTIKALFDTSKTQAGRRLSKYTYPWEVLPHIGEIAEAIGKRLPQDEYNHLGKNIWIHKSVNVPPTVALRGPAVIGPKTEIRNGAFIRGNVIAGEGVVIGNSAELKNVILFDGVQVPHFNYVGDSILGYKAHMGAGSITSNVKSDKKLIVIKNGTAKIETGIKKIGAMLGDEVEIGCGSILNPGSIIGKNTNIYPLSSVRGVVPKNSIYKKQNEIVEKI